MIVGICSLFSASLLVGAFLFYRKEKYKYASACGLLAYLILYLCFTVLCKEPASTHYYEFRPLLFNANATTCNGLSTLKHLIVCILVFVPIGILTSTIFHFDQPNRKRYKKATSLVFFISIFIELLQFATKAGILSTDDILCNLIGCIIGEYIHYRWMLNLWQGETVKRINDKHRFYDKVYCRMLFTEARAEWMIWVFLGIALVFPFTSYAWLGIHTVSLHKLKVMFDNLCYSYIAGMSFYLFTSFLSRVRKKYRAKLQLEKTFTSIYTDFKMLADKMKCLEADGKQKNNASDIMKAHMTSQSINQQSLFNWSNIFKIFCNTMNRDTPETTISEEKSSRMNNEAMQHIKVIFSLVVTEADNALDRFSDVMTDEELKSLNDFKHIHEKLFYSSLAEYINCSEIIVSNSDLDYFISDFLLNLNKSKSLANKYKQYSFYATNRDKTPKMST